MEFHTHVSEVTSDSTFAQGWRLHEAMRGKTKHVEVWHGHSGVSRQAPELSSAFQSPADEPDND